MNVRQLALILATIVLLVNVATPAGAGATALHSREYLSSPNGGVTDPAKIYLVDSANRMIMAYNAHGSRSVPNFQVDLYPADVAVDPSGNIWVGCYRNHGAYVAEYSSDGKILYGIFDGGVGGPRSIIANATGVYMQHAIGAVDFFTLNGTIFNEYFQYASNGFGVDSVGQVFVTTVFYGSLRMVTSEGVGVPIISRLAFPGPMTIDSSGNFYVTLHYYGNLSNVTIFNSKGIRTGVSFPIIGMARKIAVDAAGIIYLLTDSGLYTYHPDGTPASTTIYGNFSGMTVVG